MMSDEWLAPPSACGKRPRSPVDKLSDLVASAEDDEQDWRSSKRYLTEVIASGFSKLSFKLGMPPSPASAAGGGGSGLEGAAPAQQPLQHQGSLSPKPYQGPLLPGQLGFQQAAVQTLQLPDGDCPMEVQDSVSPPTWPPQQQQQQQQLLHKPAFLAPSPGSAAAAAAAAGGLFVPSGAWGCQQQQHSMGPQLPPPAAAAAGCAGHRTPRTPSPEPCSCEAVAGSPGAAAGSASPVGCGVAAAAGASPGAVGSQGAAAAAAAAGDEGPCSNRAAGLPPLQTAKVLRAAEKQPASPSDLPAASLRKVALLRSLLARAEAQFQSQQGAAAGQQQQQLGGGGGPHSPQPSRMQPQAGGGGLVASVSPEPDHLQLLQDVQLQQPPPLQQQRQQQQHQEVPMESSSSRPAWMQPWAALAGSSSGLLGPGTQQQGGPQQQQGPQQQLPVLPPRPVTPWDMSSDDMDCSSASSMVDSDSSSQQGCGLDPQPQPPPLQHQHQQQQQGWDQDPHQAASTLLCQEVLLPGDDEGGGGAQQQEEQGGYGSSRAWHSMQLPFHQAAADPASCTPGAAGAAAEAAGLFKQPHHAPLLQPASSSSAAAAAAPPHQQQACSRRGGGGSMLAASTAAAAAGGPGGGSPELSRHKLDELRAKALASTRQLTCLTQEDLHSLQLGLASPRRGSVDSGSGHGHTPSGLQHEGARAPSPPGLRRHSSHI